MLDSWKGSGGGNPSGSRKWLPVLTESSVSGRPGGAGAGIRSPDTHGSSPHASASPADAPGAPVGSAVGRGGGPAGELGDEG